MHKGQDASQGWELHRRVYFAGIWRTRALPFSAGAALPFWFRHIHILHAFKSNLPLFFIKKNTSPHWGSLEKRTHSIWPELLDCWGKFPSGWDSPLSCLLLIFQELFQRAHFLLGHGLLNEASLWKSKLAILYVSIVCVNNVKTAHVLWSSNLPSGTLN